MQRVQVEAHTLHEGSGQAEHREGAQRDADGERERVDDAGGIVSRHHGVHRLVEGVGRPRGLELLKGVHVLCVVEASPPAERQEGAWQGWRVLRAMCSTRRRRCAIGRLSRVSPTGRARVGVRVR